MDFPNLLEVEVKKMQSLTQAQEFGAKKSLGSALLGVAAGDQLGRVEAPAAAAEDLRTQGLLPRVERGLCGLGPWRFWGEYVRRMLVNLMISHPINQPFGGHT